jgi:N6-L-threonylcarbamoyladenine synthase/tRNA threonylcarbamoyladenosine biosynthesis protein TsaB
MLVLAIESSTRLASIALSSGDSNGIHVLAEESSNDPKSHSEFLNPAIERCLSSAGKSLQDVDLLAVGLGPGSFTGVRVAVNIARTFSFLLNKPVFVKDSLSILKAPCPQDGITIINAYKNMVYFRAFKGSQPLCDGQALRAIDLEQKLQDLGLVQPSLCLGDGYDAYKSIFSEKLLSQLIRDNSFLDYPLAKNLAHMALQNPHQTLDWKAIIPLYLRASTAEENLQSK